MKGENQMTVYFYGRCSADENFEKGSSIETQLSKATAYGVIKNLNILDYETFFSVSNLIKENKIPEILLEFNNIIDKGYESLHFINGLANHIRTLILCKDSLTIELLEVGEKTRNKYLDQSKTFDFKWLLDALSIIKEAQSNHRFSINKRLNSELCLMQLASLHFNGEKKN